jgi:hypothetical protein
VSKAEVRSEPLDQEANHILEESRMVLPGIQALFGFQLIAIYNAQLRPRCPLPNKRCTSWRSFW